MIQPHSNWIRHFTGALVFGLCAALQLHAQPAPGGFGGFGGFGGGGASTRSRSSTSTQYPRNGDLGNALVSIDPETHSLVVIADEETIAHISGVVSNLDRPQPQVLIKVVFIEVERSRGLDLGIEGAFNKGFDHSTPVTSLTTNLSVLNTYGTNGILSGASIIPSSISTVTSYLPTSFLSGTNTSGVSGLTGAGTGIYQIMGSDYQVTLRAIATAGNAKILSRPSIVARNNQPATILVGQTVPLITSVRYDSLGNAINGITYTDVGIILRVTPFITSDGLVQMILSPETSSVSKTDSTPISSGAGGIITAPFINKRSADTVVVTPDGQTVIIGGLIQDSKAENESKVPLLGDIPLLGNLFKRKVTSDSKTELIIFLTPHVIQAPSAFASLSATERAKSEAVKALNEKELERFLDTLPKKKDAKGTTKKPAKTDSNPPPVSPN
jgi:general secretion pathway protein D